MNIFCHPGAIAHASVRALLGVESNAIAEFGFKPRTPLSGDRSDNTEIDMRVGDLLVEAKPTESDFQTARTDLISRYRDLEMIFNVPELPLRNGKQGGYQLIRGTLAAHATGGSFCVLCDSRRPDLIEGWYSKPCPNAVGATNQRGSSPPLGDRQSSWKQKAPQRFDEGCEEQ
jgi:hypothetical protein